MKPATIYRGPKDVSEERDPPCPLSFSGCAASNVVSINNQAAHTPAALEPHAVQSNSSTMRTHHLHSPFLKGYKTSKPIDLSPTKITRKGLSINSGFPLILGPAEYFSNFAFVLAGSSPQGRALVSTRGLINT